MLPLRLPRPLVVPAALLLAAAGAKLTVLATASWSDNGAFWLSLAVALAAPWLVGPRLAGATRRQRAR